MFSLRYTLFTLAIVVALASCDASIFTRSCYECDSKDHSMCGENFIYAKKVKCNGLGVLIHALGKNSTGNRCVKVTMNDDKGALRILRGCDTGAIPECLPENAHNNPHNVTCHYCKRNLCNGSSSMAPIAVAVLAFVGLARIFS